MAQNQQIHLSDADARKLVEKTEGWVTGLQFTDLNLVQGGKVTYTSPSTAVGIDVFDYLGLAGSEAPARMASAFPAQKFFDRRV